MTKALNDHNKLLNGGKIMVLGLTYKKDVDDLRESPSLKIMDLLIQEDAEVSYNDPHIPEYLGFAPLSPSWHEIDAAD